MTFTILVYIIGLALFLTFYICFTLCSTNFVLCCFMFYILCSWYVVYNVVLKHFYRRKSDGVNNYKFLESHFTPNERKLGQEGLYIEIVFYEGLLWYCLACVIGGVFRSLDVLAHPLDRLKDPLVRSELGTGFLSSLCCITLSNIFQSLIRRTKNHL